MPDWLEMANSFASSPWLYAILISVSLLDSFLPLIPSEPVVIAAGAYAASGETELLWVVLATAAGAFLGDLIPYGVGRALKDRLLKRLPPGSKRRRTHDRLATELARRGGFVLVSTRFIPVGRYLATLTTGIVGYPFRNYALFTGIAAVAWSTYTVLAGFLGGLLFRDNPLLGIGVGVGMGLVVTVALEAVRHLRRKNGALDLKWSYDVRAHTPAPPSTVYAMVRDVSRWAEWQSIKSINAEDPQAPQGDLVGSVWVAHNHGATTRLQITELVPDRRLGYLSLTESIFRDYQAAFDLTPGDSGGTDIRWHATFRPRVPGTGGILERYMRRTFAEVVNRLADQANSPQS